MGNILQENYYSLRRLNLTLLLLSSSPLHPYLTWPGQARPNNKALTNFTSPFGEGIDTKRYSDSTRDLKTPNLLAIEHINSDTPTTYSIVNKDYYVFNKCLNQLD